MGGVPILTDQAAAPFSTDDFISAARNPQAATRTERVTALIPGPFRTARSDAQLRAFVARLARARGTQASVLLVCSTDAQRLCGLLAEGGARIQCVGITPGIGGVDAWCDAAHLPFADGSFDAVVVRHGLRASLRPADAAAELARVTAHGGLVYAEEPFVQATLAGPADFHRFTHLGLRGLFLGCEELDSGIVDGPGAAAASGWRQLWWSIPRSPRLGFVFQAFASLHSFFWKYFDGWLAARPRAVDSAASVFFIGSRSERTLASE